MKILAIDPGSERSAFVQVEHGEFVRHHGKIPNDQLVQLLRATAQEFDTVVIESMSPRGMPTSLQEMETCFEAGRFAEAAHRTEVDRIARDTVKLHLTGRRSKVTDSNIRAALIDRFGGAGGKETAIGRKATQGPLYGIAADEWAALALACTWLDLHG